MGRVGGEAAGCFGLEHHDFQGPEHALAQSFRVFVTARALFDTQPGQDRDWTLVAGIEVDPLLWFPPYSRERIRGGSLPGYCSEGGPVVERRAVRSSAARRRHR